LPGRGRESAPADRTAPACPPGPARTGQRAGPTPALQAASVTGDEKGRCRASTPSRKVHAVKGTESVAAQSATGAGAPGAIVPRCNSLLQIQPSGRRRAPLPGRSQRKHPAGTRIAEGLYTEPRSNGMPVNFGGTRDAVISAV